MLPGLFLSLLEISLLSYVHHPPVAFSSLLVGVYVEATKRLCVIVEVVVVEVRFTLQWNNI